MIDQSVIDTILSRVSIVDVIGEFVSLKQRGSNHFGLCPFHNEKTPSFSVNASRGFYKCFGCGASGSVTTFLIEHERMSFPEAMEYLGGLCGMEVVHDEKVEKPFDLGLVQSFFERGRPRAMQYLLSRGFTAETCEYFGVGMSPSGNYLSEKSKSKDVLARHGVLGVSDGKHYDRFRDRITWPIHNVSGKVIGWTARSENFKPKYVNSPQSDVFDKSKSLFNIYRAKKSISSENRCYLVEGPTDVMRLYQDCSISNVVCSNGTALTAEQCRLIHRFTENVTVVYDGDAAGEKATMKAIEVLLQENMNPSVFRVPSDDPDEYFRNNKCNIVHVDWLDYFVDGADLSDPVYVSLIAREAMALIRLIPDEIRQILYARRLSSILRVPVSSLGGKVISSSGDVSVEEVSVLGRHERYLAWLMIAYGDRVINVSGDNGAIECTLWKFIIDDLSADEISMTDPVCSVIVSEFSSEFRDIRYFLSHRDQAVVSMVSTMISGDYYNKDMDDENLMKDVTHTMLSMKSLIVDERRREVQNKIIDAQQSGNIDLCMELMRREGEVASLYRRINKELGRVIGI